MTKEIHITPKKIALTLLGIVLFLLVMNLLIIYLSIVKGYEHLRGFIHGFYFDAEANFPSLYSAFAIFSCSVLLWKIGTASRRYSLHWKFLALVFLFLSLDEFGSLHEYLIKPVKSLVEGTSLQSDYLYFAWFIPYTVAVLVIAILYAKFFFRLPLRTRWIFAAGGVLFLSGAVIMEMIGGKYWASQGWSVEGTDPVDLQYALIITFEELLEMTGIIVFLYGLLCYHLADRNDAYLVHVSGSSAPYRGHSHNQREEGSEQFSRDKGGQ